MWSLVVLAVLSAHPSPPCACAASRDSQSTVSHAQSQEVTGTLRLADSPNFQVHCYPGCCDARQMAQTCEAWRDHLRHKWLGETNEQVWTPRCVVVVHAQRDSYLAAVGRGGERSLGSSWINTHDDRVSGRRVDLLADQQGKITALGHELTHVVVADAFGGRQPPPWANEGIALLADSADKQARHEQDAARALGSRTAFRCLELMTIDRYPSADRIPAFYGQSASLVRMLCQRGEPHEFLSFLKKSEELGYDRALEQTYGIAGSAELQRLWDELLTQSSASSTATQKVAVNLAN